MSKLLKFDAEARLKLLNGVNILTEAVAATLGPKGRNVALDRGFSPPKVVHDGVTVAKEVELEDQFENMGAQLLKDAASQTNDIAGDGTTTSTILGRAIVVEGLKQIQTGSNPMILQKGIKTAVEQVVAELKTTAKKITTKEEVVQIATISAADPIIGQMISDAIDKVGKEGVITVEEGTTAATIVEHKEGMEFNKGFASPYFITDTERQEATITDAYILLTDKKITSMQELVPFLEKFIQVSKNIVIIADEVDGEALQSLVLNKLGSRFYPLAINAPEFGDRKKAVLEDIAVLTGATVISSDTGRTLESATVEDLGKAARVTSDKDKTVIVEGRGTKSAIDGRIGQLKAQINKATNDYEKKPLQDRLARLTGGVAVIKVGAFTQTELNEKKERVIDAVAATKAALEEGIVAGGETALLRARNSLYKLTTAIKDEQLGIDIVKKALEAPFVRLLANAGIEQTTQINQVDNAKKNYGFDVMDGQLKDLIIAGIIDPVKVTRSALQNAASVACMIMTTHVLISNKKEAAQPSQQGL